MSNRPGDHSSSPSACTKKDAMSRASFQKDLLDLSEEIRICLEDKISSTRGAANAPKLYDKFIQELKECSEPRRQVLFFFAISNHATTLYKFHKEFEELLALLFMFDWNCTEEVADAFKRLLVSLTGASAGFIEPSFQLLLQNLLPVEDDEDEDDEKSQDVSVASKGKEDSILVTQDSSHATITDEFRSKKIHEVIRDSPLQTQSVYLEEILKIADYVPVLRNRIFALILDRFLIMDVEIRLEDLQPNTASEENGQDASEAETDGMFSMEEDEPQMMGSDTKMEGTLVPAEVVAEEIDEAVERVREMAEKLDILLVKFMENCDFHCSKGPKHSKMFFKLILNLFDRYILRTRNTKFTQYIIFHVCRKKAEFVDAYLERLLQYSLSDSLPLEIRLRAAEYIASFLARALYIRVDSVESTLTYLIRWIHTYVENLNQYLESNSVMLVPKEHLQFFKLCQAVIYIIIYKGEEIRKDILEGMQWRNIAKSRCSPFPFLPRYLVEEFVTFALQNDLKLIEQEKQSVEVVDILCALKANVLNEKTLLYDSDNSDSVFPFDPCLLERTAKLVENEYQGWYSTEEGHDAYVFESESDQIDSDQDEGSDSEFSDMDLLVDRSKLPVAIRIPKITSAALRFLGGYSNGSSPPASHWGFGGIKTQSITSSLGSPSRVVGIPVGKSSKNGVSSVSSSTNMALSMNMALSSTPDIPKLMKKVAKETLQESEGSSMDSGSSLGSGEW